MALIYQCLILLSNFIHWRLNQVSLPMNRQEDSEYGTDTYDTSEPFTQTELNDLVGDLNLPRDAAELLCSRLKEKTC
jgi:hypothetical protein